jgi:transposase-like protein
MPRLGQRDPERERFWRRTMKAWARSGETIRGFCAEQGLAESAFHAWRRELRKRDGEHEGGVAGRRRRSKAVTRGNGATGATALQFVPVRVAAAASAPIEIERDGTTIRLAGGVDAAVLAQVLEAVRRASC